MKYTKLVLIVLNVLLLFYIIYLSQKLIDHKLQLKDFKFKLINLENENIIIKNYLLENISSNNLNLNDSVGNINGNKLIYRYTDLNCQDCIDSNLKILKQFQDSIGKQNISIWLYYNNKRAYTYFLRTNQYNLHIRNIEKINIPIEKSNIPYFFILDEEGNIKEVFAPIKESPDLTKSYLKIIKNKYFNAKNRNKHNLRQPAVFRQWKLESLAFGPLIEQDKSSGFPAEQFGKGAFFINKDKYISTDRAAQSVETFSHISRFAEQIITCR